jgi:eukaryotic-like serine/threonine-protein kinase
VARSALLGPGAALGRYLVASRLGAGGMGVVYAGYDPELDRKVALKVLHPGGGGGTEGRTRLLREAQALAKLAHPNVVAIHDTGTVGDDVWLAIEFVAGCTFGAWLQRSSRSASEVFAVLIDAGRGLAAAHAAGLVHRDFKPDNVMVGDDGRVRVMDFGLARATSTSEGARVDATTVSGTNVPVDDTHAPASDPSLDDTHAPASDPSLDDTHAPRGPDSRAGRSALHEVLTQAGAIAGTPAYMAPEQFAGVATDERTDQFSFCVTLWEALYGARPFTGGSFAELAANVLEGRTPGLPRGSRVPSWLGRLVQRGLARAPDDRHPSMQSLLDALARGRGRARIRRLLAVGAAVTTVGLGVVAARAIDARRRATACAHEGDSIAEVWNDDARGRVRAGLRATGIATADVTADKVMPWLDAQAERWRDAKAEACLDADVRASVTPALRERTSWCLDELRMQLDAVADALAEAEPATVHAAVSAAANLSVVARCRDDAVLERMPVPPVEARDEADALRRELARVSALDGAARYDAAKAAATEALTRAASLAWPPLVADARQRLASALLHGGDFAAAERELEAAFFEAGNAGSATLAASIADGLVLVVGERQARHADGIRWSRLAELLDPDAEGITLARHLQHRAILHHAQGEYAEAIALYERVLAIDEDALGSEHPSVALVLSNLAVVEQAAGDPARARELLERALVIRERVLGPDHRDVASTLANLANAHRGLDQLDRASELHRRALEIRERTYGPDSIDVAQSLNNLANALRDSGDVAGSAALLERALAIFEARMGPDHPHVGIAALNLAFARAETHRYGQARGDFERALAIFEAKLGKQHPNVAVALIGLAELAIVEGRRDDAIALAERALAIRRAADASAAELADATDVLTRARATAER